MFKTILEVIIRDLYTSTIIILYWPIGPCYNIECRQKKKITKPKCVIAVTDSEGNGGILTRNSNFIKYL